MDSFALKMLVGEESLLLQEFFFGGGERKKGISRQIISCWLHSHGWLTARGTVRSREFPFHLIPGELNFIESDFLSGSPIRQLFGGGGGGGGIATGVCV